SRRRLAAAAVSMSFVLLGSGAVAVSAWPLTPRLQAGASAVRTVESPAQGRQAPAVGVRHRVEVEVPSIVAAAEFSEVLIDVQADVDVDGTVVSARPATVTLHGGYRLTTSTNPPGVID